MAAPIGNEFWKLRSKHGRDKLFKTPKLLWKACEEYFQWCLDNPLIELEQSKTPARPVKDKETGELKWPPNMVKLPKMRVFTIQGLCRYLNTNTEWFRQFEENLQKEEAQNDPLTKDFSLICTRVRETIYEQKFTAAAAGFLNANIIARDLSLKDKSELSGPNGGAIQVEQITGMEIK